MDEPAPYASRVIREPTSLLLRRSDRATRWRKRRLTRIQTTVRPGLLAIAASCFGIAAGAAGFAGSVAPAARAVSNGDSARLARSCQLAVAQIGRGPYWVGIALLDPANGKKVTLTKHVGWEDSGPVWSPDGTRIVFSRTTNGSRSFQLCVMRSDGRGVHRITGGRFNDRPSWSRNGKWIAFQSATAIELVRPDGGGRHTMPGTSLASHPAWSPDSSHLTFALGAYVWTARADGSRRARGRETAWSPERSTHRLRAARRRDRDDPGFGRRGTLSLARLGARMGSGLRPHRLHALAAKQRVPGLGDERHCHGWRTATGAA